MHDSEAEGMAALILQHVRQYDCSKREKGLTEFVIGAKAGQPTDMDMGTHLEPSGEKQSIKHSDSMHGGPPNHLPTWFGLVYDGVAPYFPRYSPSPPMPQRHRIGRCSVVPSLTALDSWLVVGSREVFERDADQSVPCRMGRYPHALVICALIAQQGHRAQHVTVGTHGLLSWSPCEAPPVLA